MIDLAVMFREMQGALAAPSRPDFSSLSGFSGGQPEEQVFKEYSFSGVSGISGCQPTGSSPAKSEVVQARAHVHAGVRARGIMSGRPETPETPEIATPASCYLSGLSSLKPERPEIGGGLAPAAPLDIAPDLAAALDERAGFLEYDCGLSREAAERQARLELCRGASGLPDCDGLELWRAGLALITAHRVPCPGYRSSEWPLVYARGVSFLDMFGQQAEALGWTAPRLFGVHPQAGIGRVDYCGALVLPIGGPVLAITAEEIAFGHLTHRQKPGQPEGVPLWAFGR